MKMSKYAICPRCGKGKLHLHFGICKAGQRKKQKIYVCWVCKWGFDLETLRKIKKENEKKMKKLLSKKYRERNEKINRKLAGKKSTATKIYNQQIKKLLNNQGA